MNAPEPQPEPVADARTPLAVDLLPFLALIGAYVPWIAHFENYGLSYVVFWAKLSTVLPLAALLVGGLRFYNRRPFSGLLASLALAALYPVAQDVTFIFEPVDFMAKHLSRLLGGALTLWFLVLSVRAMRAADESAPSSADAVNRR